MSCEGSTCVSWIQLHRREAIVLLQHSACPFPSAAHLTLTGQNVAMSGHRCGMPVLEAYIGALEIDEQLVRIWTGHCARGTVD